MTMNAYRTPVDVPDLLPEAPRPPVPLTHIEQVLDIMNYGRSVPIRALFDLPMDEAVLTVSGKYKRIRMTQLLASECPAWVIVTAIQEMDRDE